MAEQIGVTTCTIQYLETNLVRTGDPFQTSDRLFLGCDAFDGSEPESVIDRLKAHRRRLGLSRKRLASLLETDPSNIAGWETGRYRPTKRSLVVIDKFLNGVRIRT